MVKVDNRSMATISLRNPHSLFAGFDSLELCEEVIPFV